MPRHGRREFEYPAGPAVEGVGMRTFGMEEEFQFLDPVTLHPANVAREAYERLASMPEWREFTHKEFLASQVEHASGVFSTLEEARSALLAFRTEVARIAADLGVVAASVGTPPDTSPFPTITEGERYQRIVDDMSGIIADHQVSGLHVHVGVPDREAGVIALNAARPWMPLLTALAANSPLWRGHDTGHDSWRTIMLRRWTTSGCPPSFLDAADYDRRIRRLLGIGGTQDLALIAWDVRLSEHLPTIEFRMADAQLDAESTLLVAALCRALVTHALERPRATDVAATASAEVPPELLSAALQHSAHYGMRAQVFDPISGGLASGSDALGGFVRLLEAELHEAGDLDAVTETTARLLRDGTGAERQRAAFRTAGMAGVRGLLDATITAHHGRNGEPLASSV